VENGSKVVYYQVSNPNEQPVRILFNPAAGNVNIDYSGGPLSGRRYDRNPATQGKAGYLKSIPAEYDLKPKESFTIRISSNGKWTYYPARGHVFWTKPTSSAKSTPPAPPTNLQMITQTGEQITVTTDIPAEYFGDYEYKHQIYGYKFSLRKDGPSYFWKQTLRDLRRPSAGADYDPARREDFSRFGVQLDQSGNILTEPKVIRFAVDVDVMKLQYEDKDKKVWTMGLYTLDGKQYAGDAVKSRTGPP
jgi:hypothetical protein